MMCPPTQSIATVPMMPMAVRTFGIAVTRALPSPAVRGFSARRRPTSSILTMSATTPYTTRVMKTATIARITVRERKPSLATSLRAMTMISAERMKSVRIALPVTLSSSAAASSPPVATVSVP